MICIMSAKKDGHLEDSFVALKMDIPSLPVIAAKVSGSAWFMNC